MKKNFISLSTFAMWMLSAALLTACGDDVQMPEKDSTEPEISTETTASTIFSTGVDGTRTKMDANRQFYWTNGDQIYVNTEGAKYKKTTSSTLYENDKKANFVLEGVKLTAEKCSVMYIGNGMASTQITADASELKVKIEAEQRQTAWDNSDHIGLSGDCGVDEATRDDATGKYSFKLTHKASYLVFQPYRAADIADKWKLLKIEIIADGTTKVAGEYDFSTGKLVGAGTSDTVSINCGNNANGTANIGTGGLELPDSASWVGGDKRSCFSVIAPGNHKLTIRYTIQPTGSVRNAERATFTIDKELPANNPDGTRTFNPNGVTTIKHKLGMILFDKDFYHYYGPNTLEDYSWVKGSPNVNEMYWYIHNGDPHWDSSFYWSPTGTGTVSGRYVYTGGLWLKKKQTILDEGNTFRSDIGKDNVDMRIEPMSAEELTNNAVLSDTERSKYFFLPALGYLTSTDIPGRGIRGYYWTRSIYPGTARPRAWVYTMVFGSDKTFISNTHYNSVYIGMSSSETSWFK